MSTSNYEFRVFIIGDYQVGKNSIVKRFKKLNSTQTEDDNFFVPGNPKTEYGLDKLNSKEAQEKYEKYQQLDVIDKGYVRKQIERKNLMKFKKIFIVGKIKEIAKYDKQIELNKNSWNRLVTLKEVLNKINIYTAEVILLKEKKLLQCEEIINKYKKEKYFTNCV